MENASNEDWDVLSGLFPVDWRKEAVLSGAVERLRGFPSVDMLLRTLLLHVGKGFSLRETAVRAKLADWADVSDVALLKRLRTSESWLRGLCLELLKEAGFSGPSAEGPNIRIVDGTIVREPGKTGSQWRILYAIRLPKLECDFLEVTAAEGIGNGESFTRLPAQSGDLILADAAYCRLPGMVAMKQKGADVLVRVNPATFVAYGSGKRRFALLQQVRKISRSGQVREWKIRLRGSGGEPMAGRLCVIRKSEQAIGRAQRRLQRRASKKQTALDPQTLELAQYVLIFTTYEKGTAAQVLQWYRMRWQIELVFKRLKSLLRLGHLPKYDDRSSRAWLYGKLLIALLTQKLIRTGREIFPWGYNIRPTI
ncbi:MAG: IS4 family transposase [Solirubrobacteraceae bacterium]